ncbi:MAG: lipopolysaccharide biosynthesis protein [Oscillospiraceae bacterium]|nr:lipopolysaccharide biosynthesis protein [Oscillospiraceae bacterium]
MNKIEAITKESAVRNSLWKLIESFASKGISLVMTIVLARLLLPQAYGVIALTNVFIQLSDILIQAGFSTALIQKKEVTDEDYSTVLCISMAAALALYTLIFLLAPTVASVYRTPALQAVLRVISLALFCQAFAAVRTAVITRAMRFRTLFYCSVLSNAISGALGIVMALLGCGVWSLVAQQLGQQVLLTVFLFCAVKMKIHFHLSKRSIAALAPASAKILASSLLSYAGDSLYSAAIGKAYSVEQLGFYEKGVQLPRQISLYTFSAVSNVFLPVFASMQDDFEKLNAMFRRVVNVSCYVIFPLMAGLCLTAVPVITLLLTEKWLPSVPILRWSCLYYTAMPLLMVNVQLQYAIGKNGTRIKIESMRLVLMVAALAVLLASRQPVVVVAAVLAFIQLMTAAAITHETVKATGYRVRDSASDLAPTVLATGLMCGVVYLVSRAPLEPLPLFAAEVAVGASVYWLLSVLFRNKAYLELVNMLKLLMRSKRR